MAQSTAAWVKEKDLGTGMTSVVYLPTDLGGAYQPLLPVSDLGNTYELWAKGTAWDTKLYLLDTKVIRAYSPIATFTITTGDTYVRGTGQTFVMRTRVDQTYSMSVKLEGVIDASTDPRENSVHLVVTGTNYNSNYSPLNADEPDALFDDVIKYNGTKNYGPSYHALTKPANKLQSVGDMKFSVVRYAADGIPDTKIAEPTLEIWPMASATITGLTEGQIYIDKIAPVTFTYRDLYPDSRTYAQIYSGPQKNNTVGTVIATSDLSFGPYYHSGLPAGSHVTVPQNADIVISGISDNYTPQDGIYTIEVITDAPFQGRKRTILKTVTFEVDRVISTRGKLSTAE